MMNRFLSRLITACAAVLLLSCAALAQFRADQKPKVLEEVGIDQLLNNRVPLDATFVDEQGRTVTLGEYFSSGKPVVLSLVYYQCPMLCGEVLKGMTSTLAAIKLEPGRDFQIVTISIDPTDTPQTATAKKQAVLGRYKRAQAEQGWHFLTGQKPQIDRVANSVGYHYRYDAPSQQYFHPAAIMVLTPQGRVAQYFYGVEYAAQDVRLGLVEASQEKIGTVIDQVLLFCYHYDAAQGHYTLAILRAVRIGAVVTLLGLGTLLGVLIRKGPRQAVKGGRA
jgi:protein SCO1/2